MSRLRLAIGIAFFLSLFASLATTRAADVRLRLLDPDGKPAAGAKAAIVPAGRTVFVTNGTTFDDDPNYVLDPVPAGFTVAVADAWSNLGGESPQDVGWGEVWATADASGSTGAWFSLTIIDASYLQGGYNGTRIDLGGRGSGAPAHPEWRPRVDA